MGRVTDEQYCTCCEVTYPHHPMLYVSCPDCDANAGQACQRPSGHESMHDTHEDRVDAAHVVGVGVCPGKDPDRSALPSDAEVPADPPFDLDEIERVDPEEVDAVEA